MHKLSWTTSMEYDTNLEQSTILKFFRKILKDTQIQIERYPYMFVFP